MSDTMTEATGEIPVSTPPPVYAKEKRVIQFGIPMLCGTIIVVLLLGFMGGITSQALFPAKQGSMGHTGKQGVAGPVGPTGATGSAANINLSAEGICYNVDTTSQGGAFWVDSVSLYTPTVNGNTKSCPSGTFVPLEPAPGAAPTQ
jgi:hypothetical protein